MWLFDWIWGLLGWLGLANKDATIIFLGLDNAGKTTLLCMLKDDRVRVHPPTFHAQMEELTIGSCRFKTYDLGGHEQARKLWREYFGICSGVVFLVDAADRERFPLAKRELDSLLAAPELAQIPFLILGNKIDLATAVSETELRAELGLMHTTGKGAGSKGELRAIEVFMCSISMGQGFGEGIRWLSQYL